MIAGFEDKVLENSSTASHFPQNKEDPNSLKDMRFLVSEMTPYNLCIWVK